MRTSFIVQTLVVQILFAISIGDGWAACIKPPVSPQSISQFKSNPQAFVAPDSDTRVIEAFVRDLAGTDASLAADFVRVAKDTSPRFQTAIAAGLAQAAIACSTVDQQEALLIQQAVAGFQDGPFQAAFAAVAGDLSTAATDAALASSAASVGSVVVTSPSTSSRSTTQPGGGGTTLPIQFTAAAISVTTPNGGANNANNNGVTNTAATTVSPIR
jgi:hypothetical protein